VDIIIWGYLSLVVMRSRFILISVSPGLLKVSCKVLRPNNLFLVCLYLSLYTSFLLFGHFFFLTHGDRKHYYIKVVESIQFACTGKSGISPSFVYKSQSDWLKYL
jgi:hypothetical protein